jgi:hypothetical protein
LRSKKKGRKRKKRKNSEIKKDKRNGKRYKSAPQFLELH